MKRTTVPTSRLLYDTNVWLSLTFSSHPHQDAARKQFSQASADHPALFCRATQQSYLRLLTTPAIQRAFASPPLTNRDALKAMAAWTNLPQVGYLSEPEGLQEKWFRAATRSTTSPKVWMDAYLAALACAAKTPLVTFDRDFQQYRDLDLILLEV